MFSVPQALPHVVYFVEAIIAACMLTPLFVGTWQLLEEGRSGGWLCLALALLLLFAFVCVTTPLWNPRGEVLLPLSLFLLWFQAHFLLVFFVQQEGPFMMTPGWMVTQDATALAGVIWLAIMNTTALGVYAAWTLWSKSVRGGSRGYAHVDAAWASESAPADVDEPMRHLPWRPTTIEESDSRGLFCTICSRDIDGGADFTELMPGHSYHDKCLHDWLRIARCGRPMRSQFPTAGAQQQVFRAPQALRRGAYGALH